MTKLQIQDIWNRLILIENLMIGVKGYDKASIHRIIMHEIRIIKNQLQSEVTRLER